MGDITHNFSHHEMECRCGCGMKIYPSVVEILQELRDYLNEHYEEGIYIVPTSGARCPSWNQHEGGSFFLNKC